MKKLFYVLSLLIIASMALAACQPAAPAETKEPAATEPAKEETKAPEATEPATATEAPAATPTLTPYPIAECQSGKTCVRWFIGMGTGTDPVQLAAEQSVVDDFNASQDKVQLIMEVVPFDSAKDTLLTEIAAGSGPDIIGPVGWSGSNALYGQWLDLSKYIAAVDTSAFNPALVKMYNTTEGQVGLPFAVYPSTIFYNTALFDEAGLNYPPSEYGPNNGPATYTWPDGKTEEWNWETLAKVAKMLTVDKNGVSSGAEGFDAANIVQYGFDWGFETQPSYVGSFYCNGGVYLAKDGKTAQLPDCWKESWKYLYDGIWGKEPFIMNGQVKASPDFANGNPFNSGKLAMVESPMWYTCCMNDVKTWDAAAMPAYKGKVAGRVDADTFRILKSSKNPDAAFQAVYYLVTEGVKKLILGSDGNAPAYGAVPARSADFQPWLDAKKAQFPQVKNWDVALAGLSFPDVPSAESYMPNYNEAWTRGQTFYNLLVNTSGLDVAKEEETLLTDLQAIFAK